MNIHYVKVHYEYNYEARTLKWSLCLPELSNTVRKNGLFIIVENA